MTPEKLAHLARCVGHRGNPACPYWRFGAGWPWPRCQFAFLSNLQAARQAVQSGDNATARQKLIAAFQAPDVSIDDAFAEGPDSNCPAGYWAGLALPDIAAEDDAKDRSTASNFVDRLGGLLARLTNEQITTWLNESVTAGRMPQRLANYVAQELGLTL